MNASIQSCKFKKRGTYNVGTLSFSSLTSDLQLLINYAESSSKIIKLPEYLTIKGLTILDKLNLSPFAPWHYLTYHKPFYFDSSYVFENLDYEPKGSNIEILIESYKSFLENPQSPNKIASPHRSKLKSSTIELIAKLLSIK